MKTTRNLFMLAGMLCLLGAAPATQPSEPVNKMCAVQKGETADPKVTTVHDGKTIAFCCSDCIPEFKKDPEKYMKDLK